MTSRRVSRPPVRVATKPVLQTRWITVHRNRFRFEEGAEELDYLVTEAAEIAMAVAVTARGRFVMVEQYKLPIEQRSLEFPAGAIDSGSALANAKRELLEEAGYGSSRWRKLGSVFADTGRCCNRIHVFACQGAERRRDPQPDRVERLCRLQVREVSPRELRGLIASGRIRSAGTLAAYALLSIRRGS